jgi:transposase-like protein
VTAKHSIGTDTDHQVLPFRLRNVRSDVGHGARRSPRAIMRQVSEVLRLKFVGGVPIREIARRVGVAPSTVRETIRRLQAAGLSWPLPEELTDGAIEERLFAAAGTKQGYRRQIQRESPQLRMLLSLERKVYPLPRQYAGTPHS